jgi:hypothetical protein
MTEFTAVNTVSTILFARNPTNIVICSFRLQSISPSPFSRMSDLWSVLGRVDPDAADTSALDGESSIAVCLFVSTPGSLLEFRKGKGQEADNKSSDGIATEKHTPNDSANHVFNIIP